MKQDINRPLFIDRKENIQKIASLDSVDLNKLTQKQRLFLDRNWKKLHEIYPEDKVYFSYYIQSSINLFPTGGHKYFDHSVKMIKFLPQVAGSDPGNALYYYMTAAEILKNGSKRKREKSKNGYYRNSIDIFDHGMLREALPYFLQGLQKPFFCNYRDVITQQRMELNLKKKPNSMIWKNYLSSVYIHDYQMYDYIKQALPLWGEELIKAKKYHEAEQILDSWSTFIQQIFESKNQGYAFFRCIQMLKHFEQKLPPLYRVLGNPNKAIQVKNLLNKLLISWNKRIDKNSPGNLLLKQEHLNYGSVIQQGSWRALLPNEYKREELADGRLYEYTQADRLLLLIIESLLGCLMIGYGLSWLLVRWRLHNKLQPVLFIPNEKKIFKLMLVGVVAPFITWWIIILLQPGGRDYSLTWNYLNYLAQGSFLILGVTLWPIVLMRYAVANRIKALGMQVKPRRYELIVVLGILLSLIIIAWLPWNSWIEFKHLDKLLDSYFHKAVREYFGVYSWEWSGTIIGWIWLTGLPIAVLAILFLVVAPVNVLLNWRQPDKLFKRGAVAAAMLAISTIILLATVLLSDGYFAWQEQRLYQLDKSQSLFGYEVAIKCETARILKILNSVKRPKPIMKINYLPAADQAFCRRVASADYADIKKALKYGANANAIDADKYSALMLACRYQKLRVVKLLLEHGAKVNVWSPGLAQIVYSPRKTYQPRIADTLTGADTLMIAAFYNSDPEIVKLLIKHGADVNSKAHKTSMRGRPYTITPLGFALKRNSRKHDNQAVINLLRKHGAKK